MTTRDPAEHLQYAFVRDGHLTSLPRRPAMLRAACAFLADRFDAGREYTESEVNALLAGDAPDHATLRRLLVDHEYLDRSGGIYWRVDLAESGSITTQQRSGMIETQFSAGRPVRG